MLKKLTIILFILFCAYGYGYAEKKEGDNPDINPAEDSTHYFTPTQDTVKSNDTLKIDSTKLHPLEIQQPTKEKPKEFIKSSYFDSLKTYFLSSRLDVYKSVQSSFFHDAGDYFRINPSYFIDDFQSTPMRKTVQPFGLSGNRLNFIVNRLPLTPFEHVVEPDGLVDLNDIPTALDHDIYLLPGPMGQLFGGKQSIATLLTLPSRPTSYTPESGLIVDKGSFSYNYVRGRYSKLFSNGKEVDLSVGYRNADGITYRRDDDAYHYTARTLVPIKDNYVLKVQGMLYNRGGSFVVQPDNNSMFLSRHRVDRSAEISLERYNEKHNLKNEIGYRYQRQSSDIDAVYKGRFANSKYGVFVGRQRISGKFLIKTGVGGNYLKYESGSDLFTRYTGHFSFNFARIKSGWRYAFTGGSKIVERYRWLPFASVLLSKETPHNFVMLSVGYSERAPSLYELNLRPQRKTIYSGGSLNYADQGNKNLSSEKQLVGNILLEQGSLDNNIRLTLTGGHIIDGIDWHYQTKSDSISAYRLFFPANGNIDFFDINLTTNLYMNDFWRFRAGGAYHYLDYKKFKDKVYQPDFQIFSGMEFHVYWPQRLLDLFAYGEIVYVDSYNGYDTTGLGNQIIANAKLSFKMKEFRFHYVFQNVLGASYQNREGFIIPGRYSYWGFIWNFFD